MYPFKQGDFATRHGSYVAASCEDIEEALVFRWILGEPVVIWMA